MSVKNVNNHFLLLIFLVITLIFITVENLTAQQLVFIVIYILYAFTALIIFLYNRSVPVSFNLLNSYTIRIMPCTKNHYNSVFPAANLAILSPIKSFIFRYLNKNSSIPIQTTEQNHQVFGTSPDEHWLQYLLEATSESIIAFNRQRKILYHNQTASNIFGLDGTETLSDDFIQKNTPFRYDKLNEIKLYLTEGKKWTGMQKIYYNETPRYFKHRIFPVLEKGELKVILVYSRDITNLTNALKKAHESEMSKTQLLANIGHEIRTPLVSILCSAEILDKAADSYSCNNNLHTILKCGNELLQIIDEILDVSAIDLNISSIRPVECNIYNLMNKIKQIINKPANEKGLVFDINIDSQVPDRLIIDEIKLRQVLINLLHNSIKFTSSGAISVYIQTITHTTSPWLNITVSDTGIGIPDTKLESIFAPFSQADNSHRRQFGGTGLGLFMCRELVDMMNGDLSIESKEKHGTTVHIKLPYEVCPNKLSTVTSTASVLKSSNSKESNFEEDVIWGFDQVHILVVEDNILNQKMICQMLNYYGFETTSVSNGLECLSELQRHNNYDLVLLDMQMPVMDGYETIKIIRSDSSLLNLPVIAVTANTIPGDREKSLQIGLTDYVSKPFSSEHLVKVIKQNLAIRNLNRKNVENELVQSLLPEFMQSLEELVEDLKTAVDAKRMKDIQSISHDIKGSAGLYGFEEISAVAATIEQAAKDSMTEMIAEKLSELLKLMKNNPVSRTSKNIPYAKVHR